MTATPRMLLAIRFARPIKTRPSCWFARLGPTVVFALLFGFAEARAQVPSVPVSGVDAALIEDIVIGSRVLADFGVLDGFGHVSARHPTNPNHFLLSRSLAPGEGAKADTVNLAVLDRIWNLWRMRIAPSLGK